jgi:predicted dehydrogenase
MRTINMALIGCGLWGPNVAKNLASNPRSTLKWICDIDQRKLGFLASRLGAVKKTTDYLEIVRDSEIDAIAIATPAKEHYKMVKAALEAGKHVFVEKPLTDSLSTSKELTELAQRSSRVLMTGYVFLFNNGIARVGELIRSGTIGEVQYLHAIRTNLGPIRTDVNVVWDLASHDVSIFLYWLNQVPVSVSATAGRYSSDALDSVVNACLRFPNGQMGLIHVSWLNPSKVREISVIGTQKMILFDDMYPSESVRIYDKVAAPTGYYDSYGSHRMAVRSGDILIPYIRSDEPLQAELEAFIDAVLEGRGNPAMGDLPVSAASVLEAIDASMRKGGVPVEVMK